MSSTTRAGWLNRTREDANGWNGPITKIYLCPCFLMKEGYSAVGPYFVVPGKAINSPVSFGDCALPFTFVQYLRNFFRWGGFAGCVSREEEFALYPGGPERPPTHQDCLTENLVPF